MFDYQPYLPPTLRGQSWRPFPQDDKLLLFDRDSGLNVLLEGEETEGLRQTAPRTLLIAVTNVCNLTCHFCYRGLTAPSLWTYDSLLEFCQQANDWGVLEAAFGGGEPMLFPRWDEFICELYETTDLAINFTTNGTRLTPEFLRSVAGRYGQIRLSIYADNHWEETIRLLVSEQARFGVNWLISRAELDGIEAKMGRLLALGVRDFLFLSYKGSDTDLHMDAAGYRRFSDFMMKAHRKLGSGAALKLGICWGHSLPDVPRLFQGDDCGAGHDFISITSDKRMKVCSFHHASLPIETLADVRLIWEQTHTQQNAARIGGCARLPKRGLDSKGYLNDEVISLAAV